jgi:hypothetical protein
MAFPFAAIGAGLGLGTQQLLQQQEQQRRNQIAQLQIMEYGQRLRQQQQLEQAAPGVLSLLSGAGGGDNLPASQFVPQAPTLAPGGATPALPGSQFMPSADSGMAPMPRTAPGALLGGGLEAGGALTKDRVLDLIAKDESGGRNIMQQVVPPGGGYNPSVGRVTGPSTAQGQYQITNSTWRETAPAAGVDLAVYPTAMTAPPEIQRKVAAQLLETRGTSPWAPYNPKLRADLAQAGAGGGGDIVPQLQQHATMGAQTAAQSIDPMLYGRMSIPAMAKRLDQVMPDAPPIVKLMALEQASKILAPDQKIQLEILMNRHKEDFQMAMQTEREKFEQAQQTRSQEFQRTQKTQYEPKLFTDAAGTQHWVRPGEDIPSGWREVNKGAGRVENVIAYKGEEKVFEGSARYDPQLGWINTADGKPIDADRFESTSKSGAGAGRAGAQVQRQVISGREIQSDLENLTKLPVVTNRGIFGSRSPGPGLMDALKENMAEELTPEDAELANSALAGIGRELSIVTSPVYGGHWASDQFNALTIKPGQTALVKVYNIARMRQVADNALEGIINTDWVGAQQKKYAQKIREDINKAVPWTTADVLAFRDHGGGETFAEFVKSRGISGAAERKGAAGAAPAAGGYQDGDTATNPQTGEKLMYRGGQWVPLPAGGVDVPRPEGPPI